MPHLQEIVVTSVGPTSAAQGSGNVSLYDINTGTSLLSFKQTSAPPHCTVAVETKDGQGGLVLAAQAEKSLLNVYAFQKDQLHLRIVLPEKLSCVAIDTLGNYCAGGTSTGRVYLWEVPSGILFNSFEAHYRRVTTLRFTSDGSALISASEDSGVGVWPIPRLLDNNVQNEIPAPYYTLSDHTLPVTDIVCGVGVFPHCRVLTASLDNSCKDSIALGFVHSHPAHNFSFPASNRRDSNGCHRAKRTDKIGHRSNAMEAVGGAGLGIAERIDQEEAAEKQRIIVVGYPVTSMAISITSALLIVGTSTGHIQIYDIASQQLIHSIVAHKDFSINDVRTMLKPRDLMGHASLGDPTSFKESNPIRSIAPFQRTRDPKTRENHEVLMMPPAHPATINPRAPGPTFSDLIEDHRFFTQSTLVASSTAALGPASSARIAELEAELAQAREQLTRAKNLNNALWESTVTAILADKKVKTSTPAEETSTTPVNSGTEAEDLSSGRAKKRGRTD